MTVPPSLFQGLAQGAVLLAVAGGLSVGRAQPASDSSQVDTLGVRDHLEPILDSFDAAQQTSDQLAERYAALAETPFNLNEATVSDLSTIPGLSAGQAHRIVRHRAKQGPFKQVITLRAVDGVSPATVRAVRPFLRIDSTAPEGSGWGSLPAFNTILSNLELDVIQRMTRRLDLGRGYREDRFLGPPGRLTSRVRLHYERHFQLALTLDKDPGEPFRWAPSTDTYGFDHVVGSVALRDIGILKTLVVGDFTAQFGQGVALWQGFRLGKGRNPIAPAFRSGGGLRAYQSASESGFFRGIGVTLDLGANLFATAFASRRHRDASIDSSLAVHTPPEAPMPVRTIAQGGRHRTLGEIARKGTFGETTVGGAVEYRRPSFHLGLTGYQSRFDRPLRPGNKPYRSFRVSGRQTSMMSLYTMASLGDYLLFGEIARAANGTYGGMGGAVLDQDERVQAVLLGRYYPSHFANFYGNAFGELGATQNEIGFYTGLRLQVAKDWRIGVYVDQFRSPWLRFNVPAPSAGWEARAILEHDPRPWLSTYLQVRAQSEEQGTEHVGPGGRILESVHRERRQSVRWHTEYTFSEALTLRTRLEVSHYSTPKTSANGFLLFQGVRLTPLPSLQMDARIAFFDTDGYAARIYAYEYDLLYSFSVPVFFDRGRRSYILVQYEPTRSLTLEAKYGVTRYANRNTTGSGLNQVPGSRRREIRFQIRWDL